MADTSRDYPWVDFFKGTIIIFAAIFIFNITEKGEDSITTVARLLMRTTGVILNSVYLAFTLLERIVRSHLWIPLIFLIVTWILFPEIVEDLLFLIRIGFRRYKSLLF